MNKKDFHWFVKARKEYLDGEGLVRGLTLSARRKTPDVYTGRPPDCGGFPTYLRFDETNRETFLKGNMPRRNGRIETSSFQECKAQLAEDLRLVAHDAEELVKATGGELSSAAREIQERLKGLLHDAQETCERLEEQAGAGIKAMDLVIRNNPYRAIGIAMGVGFLAAYLAKRKL